jgi:hypothetical protein
MLALGPPDGHARLDVRVLLSACCALRLLWLLLRSAPAGHTQDRDTGPSCLHLH